MTRDSPSRKLCGNPGAWSPTRTCGTETAAKAVHAAAAATPTKRQHALACLEKAVNFRREDMKKHARNRRCKGECPESRNCWDCKMRGSHEFMLRLMCESGDAIKALQAGAA